ncbi:MAG: hypothetical protein R3D65_03680 [Zhengella sp.]|uniref:hypothetical protein n=1 Tax=Zhengella sp. TaxID=2282762 RepID=UPI001D6BD627|nr:hypothetical protein [Notoacmeibacter sp.]MCC0026160.1 hypothetical protein [Brucellaceae bacterium]
MLPVRDESEPRSRIQIVNTPPLAPDDLPPLAGSLLPEDFLFEAGDLDGETCPPDMIVERGDRAAWVYDHGEIADILFVRT